MLKLRLKRVGRSGAPAYRLVVMDSRTRRDGRPVEELGFYDPISKNYKFDIPKIEKWIGVGAKPTEKVKVLIDKYGPEGTHLEAQAEAFARLQANKPMAPPPEALPSFDEPEPEAVTEETAEATEAPAEEAPAEEAVTEEAVTEEAVTEEATEAPAEEAAAEEAPTEEAEAPAEAEAEAAETSAEEAADEEASE